MKRASRELLRATTTTVLRQNVGRKCEHGITKQVCRRATVKRSVLTVILKRNCRACGGRGVYPHGKRKYDCKECGGGAWCTHGISEKHCNECVVSGLCPHGKNKRRCCKECCCARGICPHWKQKRFVRIMVARHCCIRLHCMRRVQTGGTKNIAYVALPICFRVSPWSEITR